MVKNKWVFISITLIFFISIGTWGVWYLLNNSMEEKQMDQKSASLQPEGGKDEGSSEVVHERASEEIVEFANHQYENGHEFISEFHEFYNETLCWGRVNNANYIEQKEKALEIIDVFKGIKIHEKDLYKDFSQIEQTAQKVSESDDRQAMISLHRLFHDLDIYINGYSRDDTFGVTDFKGF